MKRKRVSTVMICALIWPLFGLPTSWKPWLNIQFIIPLSEWISGVSLDHSSENIISKRASHHGLNQSGSRLPTSLSDTVHWKVVLLTNFARWQCSLKGCYLNGCLALGGNNAAEEALKTFAHRAALQSLKLCPLEPSETRKRLDRLLSPSLWTCQTLAETLKTTQRAEVAADILQSQQRGMLSLVTPSVRRVSLQSWVPILSQNFPAGLSSFSCREAILKIRHYQKPSRASLSCSIL